MWKEHRLPEHRVGDLTVHDHRLKHGTFSYNKLDHSMDNTQQVSETKQTGEQTTLTDNPGGVAVGNKMVKFKLLKNEQVTVRYMLHHSFEMTR